MTHKLTDKESRYVGAVGYVTEDKARRRLQVVDAHERADGSVDCQVRYINDDKTEVLPSNALTLSPDYHR